MARIIEIPDIEYRPVFTCKKCGGNSTVTSVLNVPQMVTPRLGWCVGIICQNCRTILRIEDKAFHEGPRDGPVRICELLTRGN